MNRPPTKGLPLGDFKPSDQWQTHVNAIFYGILGPQIHHHFQTYVSRDYRLAHALAEDFFKRADPSGGGSPWVIHEWGVGNGNLAACFLSHLQSLDGDRRVYPNTRYLLCDYSEEILKGVRSNPRLAPHRDRFSTIRVNAGRLDCFRQRSADKIISNEIWDDMATKVLLKHDGLLYEEVLRPTLDPDVVGGDFKGLQNLFSDKILEELNRFPDFLQAIEWERDYQRVDTGDWPYAEILEAHIDRLADEIPVPINIGAFRTLEQARRILKPESQGYSGFDYGMYSFQDLNREGRPYFNLYGGQYTFMVNFELLAEVGRALGFQSVAKEYQHRYVSRNLQQKAVSVVEILQSHPQVAQLASWDRDLLMLNTLHAINGNYSSPYKNKLEYPPMPGTPKKQRKQIAQLAQSLSPLGVPDTVAYVTEGEVLPALKQLKRLGYREKALQGVFDRPADPVSFIGIHFR